MAETSALEPRPLGCPACQACGFWHCSDPLRCGGMRWDAAAQAVRAGEAMSDTPITDQLKAMLGLVGTILHQGTQQDLDKLHLWLADYADVVTARRTDGEAHA